MENVLSLCTPAVREQRGSAVSKRVKCAQMQHRVFKNNSVSFQGVAHIWASGCPDAVYVSGWKWELVEPFAGSHFRMQSSRQEVMQLGL